MRRGGWVLVAAWGCGTEAPSDDTDTRAAPSEAAVPEDPAEPGYPVGVQTIDARGQRIEVWYPAAIEAPGTDTVALAELVPQAFVDRVAGSVPLPSYEQPAVRGAPVRAGDTPWPVVLFSHGFGGFRTQSSELTAHLASRGYLVVSADHPGRSLADIAPCLVEPPAGPCGLSFPPSFDGEDPALADLADVVSWIDGWPVEAPAGLAEAADRSVFGLFGHSAGGGSTTAFAGIEPRVVAALPMAGAGAFEVDVDSAVIGGRCDAIVTESRLTGAGATARGGYWSLAGAGHLAFSDLCTVDLGAIADAIEARDDANGAFLLGLRALATDGCPAAAPRVDDPSCADAYLPLARSGEILRYAVTAFFDRALKGEGEGLSAEVYAELTQPAP